MHRPNHSSCFPFCLVSGGQTGSDRAGLDFALANNLVHGGFCPAARKSEDGRIPEIYNLIETESRDYPERTRRNVRLGDATVIFSTRTLAGLRRIRLGSGSALTVRECERQARPYLVLSNFPSSCTDAAELKAFLTAHSPRTLNIAGSSENRTPGIYAHVLAVLALVAAEMPKSNHSAPPMAGDPMTNETRRMEQLISLSRSDSRQSLNQTYPERAAE